MDNKIDEDSLEELFDFEYDTDSESIGKIILSIEEVETVDVSTDLIPDTIKVFTNWDGFEGSSVIIVKG